MACYGNIIYGPTAGDAVPDSLTNVVLPTTGHPKLSIVPVMADDGVNVMYYEYTVTVDTIIYLENSILGDVEDEAARIRGILTKNGQQLVVSPVGLGTLPTINHSSGKSDVKGGPYTQELDVEGYLSNNAIIIKWIVMFRINHCPDNVYDLVQFTSEIDLDIDEEGAITFNLRVTYQRRVPFSDISVLSSLVDALAQNAGMSFQGMKRRKRTSFSRDMRTVQIHIEYKEITSDSPFFPETKNVEATDEISSELFATGLASGRGFYSWNRRLSVNVTLPARVHKSYAYIIFRKIAKQRFRNLHQLGKTAALLDTTPVEGQPAASTTKNSFLMLRLKIGNPIYTRQMKIEADYIIVTDLLTLLSKTQICARVNSKFDNDEAMTGARPLSEQWKLWNDSDDDLLNGPFEYEVSGIPITYSHCTGTHSNPRFGATALLPLEADPDLEPDPPSETAEEDELPNQYESAYNWVDYDNAFSIIEETDNIQVSYLQPTPSPNYYRSDESYAASAANREATGYNINGTVTSTANDSQLPKTISRGTSVFKVRMKGYAIRVKDKIPIPVIVSVGGKPANRTGVFKSFQKQIVKGDVPVYFAAWDIVYTVDGDIQSADILNSIKTSGAPGHYS